MVRSTGPPEGGPTWGVTIKDTRTWHCRAAGYWGDDMHKLNRRVAVTIAAALIAGAPLIAGASHSWGGYHWARTANPFTLELGDNVDNSWDGYLLTTSTDWSSSAVLNTTVKPGATSSRTCKSTKGRVEVCNNSYGNTGWLGVAGISITGGEHITAAYVKLNDSYFSSGTYNTVAWRNLVMCQEVGHTFGLDHQDENFNNANLSTCMDYTNSPSSNQHPNRHDFDELETIYGHLDSFTTVISSDGGGGGGGGGGSCNPKSPKCNPGSNDPSGWGRLVSTSRDGHRQVFELDLGNGNKVITHVFWAEARGRRPQH